MNNPFKVGDVVYTTYINDGSLKIGSIHESGCYVGKDLDHKGAKSRWSLYEDISFTPWPKPNHTRPFEAVLKRGDEVIVRDGGDNTLRAIVVVRETEHYVESNVMRYLKGRNNFYRIGEEVKFN